MRRSPALVWIAFLAAHLLVAWLGWVLPSLPMGDVILVYQPWSQMALGGWEIVGVTETWVYPQLALLPMLLTEGMSILLAPIAGSGSYLIAWAVLVTAIDALGLAVLLGSGRSAVRRRAAWFWIAALVLLGPIAMYRIDAITVPIAIMGGVWLLSRPALASALFTLGAWMKIWPAALVLACVAVLKARWRVIVAAGAVTVVVVVALVSLGGGSHLLGFLTEQTGRGLQIEAVAATPFLWLAAFGGARIAYSQDILTFQIAAPGADAVSAVLTPLMALVAVGIAGLAVWRVRAGADPMRLLPPTMLALVTALIVCNKVGSPQFQTWMLAPMVLWWLYDRNRAGLPAALVLAACVLTQVVYPITYDALLAAEPFPIVVISLRNAIVVALCVLSIRTLVRTPSSRIVTH
ncbi:hypothetical protein J2Y69_000981 [Microbacterium resistens]|uniref:DUF2029 domain-containing protein n=1 Tax=Microbacterium resistens TaxID=156977 RepID=A0ABU1S9W1_9MICO|nr:hypothetical protein [Microbacterium resistens]MDR6866389.1 hypothetical protein [Microbacterium resistens]